jgi:hypothetical protein
MFSDRHSNIVTRKGKENIADTLNGRGVKMGLPGRPFWASPRWRERGAFLVLVHFPGTSMTPHLEALLTTGINSDEWVWDEFI